jgi:hypothetical protein
MEEETLLRFFRMLVDGSRPIRWRNRNDTDHKALFVSPSQNMCCGRGRVRASPSAIAPRVLDIASYRAPVEPGQCLDYGFDSQQTFSLHHRFQTFSGAYSAFCLGSFCPGLKRQQNENDCLPPSSAEVKNACSYISFHLRHSQPRKNALWNVSCAVCPRTFRMCSLQLVKE